MHNDTTIARHLGATYDPETETPDNIVVDANLYRIRMLHTSYDGLITASLEFKANEIKRAVEFVRRRTERSHAVLIGIRHDRWPEGLLAALVQNFGPVHWIPQRELTTSTRSFRKVMHLTKFMRAYMAAAAWSSQNEPSRLEQWRRMMLFELDYSLQLTVPDTDDIPF